MPARGSCVGWRRQTREWQEGLDWRESPTARRAEPERLCPRAGRGGKRIHARTHRLEGDDVACCVGWSVRTRCWEPKRQRASARRGSPQVCRFRAQAMRSFSLGRVIGRQSRPMGTHLPRRFNQTTLRSYYMNPVVSVVLRSAGPK